MRNGKTENVILILVTSYGVISRAMNVLFLFQIKVFGLINEEWKNKLGISENTRVFCR